MTTFVPLTIEDHGREFARYNCNDTWTVDWETVQRLAALNLDATDWPDKGSIGLARLLCAARHNFYEIPLAEAEKLAEEAETNVMIEEQLVGFPF